MRSAAGTPHGTSEFSRLLWGAGGYMTGGDVADDGTVVARTDEKVGYILEPGEVQWRELMRFGENVQQADLAFPVGFGTDTSHCMEVAICATNSNVIYQAWHGRVWKTTNKTASWVATAFPFSGTLHAATARIGFRRMAVDPVNPDVVGLGHPLDGFYYTVDGGNTWVLHPDLPIPTSIAGVQVAFDRSSAVVGGRTQTVIVHVTGHGMYRSTTGITGTFTLMSGSPTAVGYVLAANGKIYTSGTTFTRFDGAAWTTLAMNLRSIARHPSVANVIYAINSAGDMSISVNDGVSWASLCTTAAMSIISPDIPWLAKTRVFTADAVPAFAKVSDCSWMHFLPGDKMLLLNGIGAVMFDTMPVTANQPVSGYHVSQGIENIVGAELTIAPNGRLHATCHDRGYFCFDVSAAGRKLYPADNHFDGRFQHGHGVDWAIDDPNYVVAVYQVGPVKITTSSDGGRTMNAVAGALPTLSNGQAFTGGNVACSNAGNFIWAPNSAGAAGANYGRIAWTKDGGASFGYATFAGGSSEAPWLNSYLLARQVLAADKSVPGRFYAYHSGISTSDPNAGLWRSDDGGENFYKTRSGAIIGYGTDFWNGKLRLVGHGKPGHMFWCPGGVGSVFDTPTTGLINFSSDEFATVNITMPGWFEPDDVAVGANLPGAAYPAVYVYGARAADMKARGLYRCLDFNPATANGTWTLIEYNPGGTHGVQNIMVADPQVFGRVYFLTGGLSAYVGDYADHAVAM